MVHSVITRGIFRLFAEVWKSSVNRLDISGPHFHSDFVYTTHCKWRIVHCVCPGWIRALMWHKMSQGFHWRLSGGELYESCKLAAVNASCATPWTPRGQTLSSKWMNLLFTEVGYPCVCKVASCVLSPGSTAKCLCSEFWNKLFSVSTLARHTTVSCKMSLVFDACRRHRTGWASISVTVK